MKIRRDKQRVWTDMLILNYILFYPYIEYNFPTVCVIHENIKFYTHSYTSMDDVHKRKEREYLTSCTFPHFISRWPCYFLFFIFFFYGIITLLKKKEPFSSFFLNILQFHFFQIFQIFQTFFISSAFLNIKWKQSEIISKCVLWIF